MEKIIIYQGEKILGYANMPRRKQLDEEIKSKIHRWVMIDCDKEDVKVLQYLEKDELIEVLYTTLEQNGVLAHHSN